MPWELWQLSQACEWGHMLHMAQGRSGGAKRNQPYVLGFLSVARFLLRL